MKYSDRIDETVDRFIEERVNKLSPLDAKSYFSIRNARIDDPKSKLITESLLRIHSNISALPTHISAMIAALVIILIVFEDSKMTQFFILMEMIGYTVFAIVCVYCLRYKKIMPIKDRISDDRYIEGYYHIFLSRRYIYDMLEWCFNKYHLIFYYHSSSCYYAASFGVSLRVLG